MTNDPILATFVVLSYNQKRYLEKALLGAERQTYRPLEVVVSDDGSRDGSWEMIKEWKHVFESKHPEVSVVLNRNEPNLGMLGNWQRAISVSHGELIVKADGDDVSMPERTAKLVAAWRQDGEKALAVFSDAYMIDAEDRVVGRMPAPHVYHPCGAVSAWARELYSRFPAECTHDRVVEDSVYGFRSRMLGGSEVRVLEPLVYYRVGTGCSTSFFDVRESLIRTMRLFLSSSEETFVDLRFIRDTIEESLYVALAKELDTRRKTAQTFLSMCESPSLRERMAAFRVVRSSVRCKCFSTTMFLWVCMVMPRFLGNFPLFLYVALRYWVRRFQYRRVKVL